MKKFNIFGLLLILSVVISSCGGGPFLKPVPDSKLTKEFNSSYQQMRNSRSEFLKDKTNSNRAIFVKNYKKFDSLLDKINLDDNAYSISHYEVRQYFFVIEETEQKLENDYRYLLSKNPKFKDRLLETELMSAPIFPFEKIKALDLKIRSFEVKPGQQFYYINGVRFEK